MKIEGIVLSKTLYKEKDLICNLLLRSGDTLTVYFYGGKGGGKNLKGSIIELGFMLKIELQKAKKNLDTQIHIAKEYSLLWHSENIRNDYSAFCLASFYLELIQKITSDAALDNLESLHNQGLFKVLSNALFFLDDALAKKNFQLNQQLFIFLTKIIIELGINPDTKNCLYCHKAFAMNDLCLFDYTDGGFSCMDCSSQKDEFLSENRNLLMEHQSAQVLRQKLDVVYQTSFKNYISLKNVEKANVVSLFNYLNYQTGLKTENFKTWPAL